MADESGRADCRRQHLLAYFGEESAPCGNCDNCLNPPQTWDATEAARKALSCVYRTGQRYGAGHLIDVLRGKVTDKVTQRGHERLSTFGIGADVAEQQWRSVLRQLIALGHVRSVGEFYTHVSKGMSVNSIRDLDMEKALKVTIDNNEFRVHLKYEKREGLIENLDLVARFDQEFRVRMP